MDGVALLLFAEATRSHRAYVAVVVWKGGAGPFKHSSIHRLGPGNIVNLHFASQARVLLIRSQQPLETRGLNSLMQLQNETMSLPPAAPFGPTIRHAPHVKSHAECKSSNVPCSAVD